MILIWVRNMKEVIKASNLTKYYPLLPKRFFDLSTLKYYVNSKYCNGIVALYNVSFSVEEGEICCIIGPNGAGKTTLCKIAAGLLEPTSGYLKILGYDSVKEHSKIAKDIFVIFADYIGAWDLFQYRISVYDNLKFISKLWNVPSDVFEYRLNKILKEINLGGKLKEWYQRLSRGHKQIVWIIAAYIINPKVLILDEPTVHLSPLMRNKFYDIITELTEHNKTTILITSHNIDNIKICDKVILLNKRVLFKGTIQDLQALNRALLKDAAEFSRGDVIAKISISTK